MGDAVPCAGFVFVPVCTTCVNITMRLRRARQGRGAAAERPDDCDGNFRLFEREVG